MNTTDQGQRFGLWNDPTSRLIYRDAMGALLSGVDRTGSTLDLGGGNGLSREWFDQVTTVDIDPTKAPDVEADILTYTPPVPPTRVLMRYVLHYLTDPQVIDLLDHIAGYCGELVVIQFVNDDLAAKQANSVNETKVFRTEAHLRSLVERSWSITRRISVGYRVDPQFYVNRLGHQDPTPHDEIVVSYLCHRAAVPPV